MTSPKLFSAYKEDGTELKIIIMSHELRSTPQLKDGETDHLGEKVTFWLQDRSSKLTVVDENTLRVLETGELVRLKR